MGTGSSVRSVGQRQWLAQRRHEAQQHRASSHSHMRSRRRLAGVVPPSLALLLPSVRADGTVGRATAVTYSSTRELSASVVFPCVFSSST